MTGWGLLVSAAVVATLLAAMMLWALDFMDDAIVTPPAHLESVQ